MALLTRRRLLFTGLGLAGAGAVGAMAVAGLRQKADSVAGLRVLTPEQHRTMRLVAAAHVPAGGAFAWSAADVDVAGLFDGFLGDQPPGDQSDAGLALDLIDFGPLLFERRWTTFADLSDAERQAHWLSWSVASQATRREIFWSFGRFIGMAVYDQAGAWPAVGYKGPSFGRLQ